MNHSEPWAWELFPYSLWSVLVCVWWVWKGCEGFSDQEGYRWRRCRPAGWALSFSADSSVVAVWAVLSIGPTVSLGPWLVLDALHPSPPLCESTHQHNTETSQNRINRSLISLWISVFCSNIITQIPEMLKGEIFERMSHGLRAHVLLQQSRRHQFPLRWVQQSLNMAA